MNKLKPSHKSTRRVQQYLIENGLDIQIIEFDQSTRTASEAAAAVGCDVAQIVKSLVFRMGSTPLLLLVSGANRVDVKKIGKQFGEDLCMADADFTHAHTGYAIGGVPPVAHDEDIETWMDETLLDFDFIWAAAGNPRSVFKIESRELMRLSKSKTLKVN